MPKKMDVSDPAALFPSKKPAGSKFECLLSGDVYRFLLNVDFQRSGESMIAEAKRYARDNCLFCEAKRDGSDIILWFREPNALDIKRSKMLRAAIARRDAEQAEATESDCVVPAQ